MTYAAKLKTAQRKFPKAEDARGDIGPTPAGATMTIVELGAGPHNTTLFDIHERKGHMYVGVATEELPCAHVKTQVQQLQDTNPSILVLFTMGYNTYVEKQS
mgnify:CR=1 FL=1